MNAGTIRGSSPALIHLAVQSQAVAEAVLFAGFDGVVVDLQHGEIGIDGACTILRSIPREVSHAYARIASIDSGAIGRLLDSGARGLIAPSVENADEARAFVAAVKYPPVGGRSIGPSRPALYSGDDYTVAGNRAVAAIVQIETKGGLDAADEIMSVPGIDSVYIGPGDLAVSLGLPGRLDWEEGPVWEAIIELGAVARSRGLTFGVFCLSSAYAATLIDRGLVDFIGLGTDLMILSNAAREHLSELRSKP